MLEPPSRCPLCIRRELVQFATVHDRIYWRCTHCLLTFMEPSHRLTYEEEFERYKQHNNDSHDPDYRAFLARLTDCMVPHLAPGSRGLDYGSGPGPTTHLILAEQGFHVSNYDPFFTQDAALFRTYHFITCSETAEHFYNPAYEFARINMLLEPHGVLGVMTNLLYDDIEFESWWYIKDPTHASFYHPKTFEWLAEQYRWRVEFPRENVVLFFKPDQE